MENIDVVKPCSGRNFLTSQKCLFNIIRENNILAEISEFTVPIST